MHELIASRYKDEFLLVRPGHRNGVNIGRRRYEEMAACVTQAMATLLGQEPMAASPQTVKAHPGPRTDARLRERRTVVIRE